jgi:hypothetical protein
VAGFKITYKHQSFYAQTTNIQEKLRQWLQKLVTLMFMASNNYYCLKKKKKSLPPTVI